MASHSETLHSNQLNQEKVDLSNSKKHNYGLIVKIDYGTYDAQDSAKIRQWLFRNIKNPGVWQSSHTATSSFYFARDDDEEGDFVAKQKRKLDELAEKMRKKYPDVGGFVFFIFKPLSANTAHKDDILESLESFFEHK
jgi:hypothetical protein